MGTFDVGAKTSRLANIQRGSYYFGIFGRLSVFWGILGLGMALFLLATVGFEADKNIVGLLGSSIPALVYGWLFLLGRDALTAVSDLIKDMDEIV